MAIYPILDFGFPYDWLSNFYIEPDGTHVEGEYQASKTEPPTEWLKTTSPRRAKAVGRKLVLMANWEDVKVAIMQELVRQKFADHPELAARLKATGTVKIVEGNWWGDTFWGVCQGRGQNVLGEILMDVRKEL